MEKERNFYISVKYSTAEALIRDLQLKLTQIKSNQMRRGKDWSAESSEPINSIQT